MKFTVVDLSNVSELSDVRRFTALSINQLASIVNNGLLFSDNFDATIVTVNFAANNVDQAIAHGLNRIPSGYIELTKSVAMIVYTGSGTWTTSSIYLRSNAVGTANILIF